MKGILAVWGFLLFWNASVAQNALMDAIYLSHFLDSAKSNLVGKQIARFKSDDQSVSEIIKVFRKYVTTDFQSGNAFTDMIERNSFLGTQDSTKRIVLGGQLTDAPIPRSQGSPQPLANQGKGLFIPRLADGMAKFLVTRTKDELNIAFFQRMSSKLEKQEDLRAFFPRTTEILLFIGQDIYRYQQFLENLRNTFGEDMKNLPSNVKNWLAKGKGITDPDENLLVQDLLELSQALLDERKITEIIEYLGKSARVHEFVKPTVQSPPSKIQNLSAGLKTAYQLSESLRKETALGEANLWFTPKEILDTLEDERIRYLYLALLWQQTANIEFVKGKTFRSFLEELNANSTDLSLFIGFIRNFSRLGNEMSQNIEALSEEIRRDSAGILDYQLAISSVFEFLEQGMLFTNTFIRPPKDLLQRDSIFLKALRHFNTLNLHVRQNNYPQALYHAVSTIDAFVQKKEGWRKDMLNIGMFGAQVATASDSDEIAAIIENFALPPQSALVKRSKPFTLSFNAYTAVMGGSERLDSAGFDQREAVFGIAAPLGLEFGFGLGKCGSLSAFFSAIDLGAITALRFNDFTKPLPEFSLSNIVAPGIYGIYGLPKIPLSIGAGWQKGPQLRKVTPEGAPEFSASGSRWNVFIGVDIPLLFFNR